MSRSFKLLMLITGIVLITSAYYFTSDVTFLFTLHNISLTLLVFKANLCILMPIAFALIFIELKPSISRLYEVCLWVILFLTVCSSCSMSVLTVFKDYRYRDSLYTDSHAYHVDSSWAVGVGGDSKSVYVIWQCDRLDLLCRTIARHYEGMEHNFDDSIAKLQLNVEHNTIEFWLDGNLKYVIKQ